MSFGNLVHKESFNKNSNFLIEGGYNSVHFERATNKRGGGVCIYIHNTLMHNVISDLSISDDDNETLVIEIINKESKNVLICVSYRPPGVQTKPPKTKTPETKPPRQKPQRQKPPSQITKQTKPPKTRSG